MDKERVGRGHPGEGKGVGILPLPLELRRPPQLPCRVMAQPEWEVTLRSYPHLPGVLQGPINTAFTPYILPGSDSL